ncbi:DNA-binding protein YbaB [Streptomyces sp. 1114.5]|uniref:YbaB/EbfC family nucleoid-associated protein n=1 Tax=unclassified Streptomyces TaxID=2593676 RepID=UPI000BD4E5B5|nr:MULTISPECIES: YbaB/EbfC family nucleoid-associated protein [unclassified Streptomyces]RKT16551.1 DNA-binding protein YbaB [Streptomyces sp. 1114.5]SOB82720.1 Conserved DNA-binding protein YbaB [Streptomyces sp. 1331.2]
MSNPFADQIAQAMAEMQTELARAEELQKEMFELTASVTSKDRLVTVKVGSQGQVVSMTFHTDGYREMAPAELAKVLTDTLNEARAKVGEDVAERIGRFDGLGETLRLNMTGGTELDEILAPLWAMKPDYQPEDQKKKADRQEEFRG